MRCDICDLTVRISTASHFCGLLRTFAGDLVMQILRGIQFVSGLLISRMDTTTVQVPIDGEVEKIRHRKKLFLKITIPPPLTSMLSFFLMEKTIVRG